MSPLTQGLNYRSACDAVARKNEVLAGSEQSVIADSVVADWSTTAMP